MAKVAVDVVAKKSRAVAASLILVRDDLAPGKEAARPAGAGAEGAGEVVFKETAAEPFITERCTNRTSAATTTISDAPSSDDRGVEFMARGSESMARGGEFMTRGDDRTQRKPSGGVGGVVGAASGFSLSGGGSELDDLD
jgi:hypothetical protein